MENDISEDIEIIKHIESNIPKSLTPQVKLLYITFDDNYQVNNLSNTGISISIPEISETGILYYLELEDSSLIQGLYVINMMVSYNEINLNDTYKPIPNWVNPISNRSILIKMLALVYNSTYKLIDPKLLHIVIFYIP